VSNFSGTRPASTPAMAKQAEMTSPLPTTKKLEELYELIDGIEIAMLTTRNRDGALV
jgi:hypothetical protein